MRLTEICRLFGPKPIGFQYRGKNRKLKIIQLHHLLNIKKDLEREEENMLILRHPYLTIEQEHGHVVHFREDKFEAMKERANNFRWQKFCQPIRIEDRLKSLMINDNWE